MGQSLSQRVLLTGATGFVGAHVGRLLVARGYQVVALVRDMEHAQATLRFPAELREWRNPGTLEDIDAVVHLAGEPVGKRWTAIQKKKIRASRVETTAQLRVLVAQMAGRRPKVAVLASAIGYYGDRGDEWLPEESAPGTGFLPGVCQAWETESKELAAQLPRGVVLRFGLVLGGEGGALAKILPLFRKNLGGRIGRGTQWMSWIHLDDLGELILFAITQKTVKGTFNAVAPEPVTNAAFTSGLANALGRVAPFPVPRFALRLALGEMSTLLLESQRVSAQKALQAGFLFRFPTLAQALQSILGARS